MNKPPACWECPDCRAVTDKFHCYVAGCEWLVCKECAVLWNAFDMDERMHAYDLYDPEYLYLLPARQK